MSIRKILLSACAAAALVTGTGSTWTNTATLYVGGDKLSAASN